MCRLERSVCRSGPLGRLAGTTCLWIADREIRPGLQEPWTRTDIATKGQHCRAEVYLREHGWAPVDPADVRKVALEEPPGNHPLSDEIVSRARDYLFGSWEMNWMAYSYAHDVDLPGSARPLVYFMYPQVREVS
jgi:transglutaminase-like putative cysteine protease